MHDPLTFFPTRGYPLHLFSFVHGSLFASGSLIRRMLVLTPIAMAKFLFPTHAQSAHATGARAAILMNGLPVEGSSLWAMGTPSLPSARKTVRKTVRGLPSLRPNRGMGLLRRSTPYYRSRWTAVPIRGFLSGYYSVWVYLDQYNISTWNVLLGWGARDVDPGPGVQLDWIGHIMLDSGGDGQLQGVRQLYYVNKWCATNYHPYTCPNNTGYRNSSGNYFMTMSSPAGIVPFPDH
jgi:hypothetical protein